MKMEALEDVNWSSSSGEERESNSSSDDDIFELYCFIQIKLGNVKDMEAPENKFNKISYLNRAAYSTISIK